MTQQLRELANGHHISLTARGRRPQFRVGTAPVFPGCLAVVHEEVLSSDSPPDEVVKNLPSAGSPRSPKHLRREF